MTQQERESYMMSKLLETEEGRWFIWLLLNQSGFYNEIFSGSSKDYYLKGCRAVGTFIHKKVREVENFSIFDLMEQEENRRQCDYQKEE